MKLIGIRTPKPRQFNYKPVFYDKEKEEFEKRLHESRLGDQDPGKEELRRKLQHGWKIREKQDQKRKGLRKLLLAIFLLIVLIYIIFFS